MTICQFRRVRSANCCTYTKQTYTASNEQRPNKADTQADTQTHISRKIVRRYIYRQAAGRHQFQRRFVAPRCRGADLQDDAPIHH